MTRPDLVLHLGPPHDAITMLREVLVQLRPQLRQHGVAYVAAPRDDQARTVTQLLSSEQTQTHSVRHGPCPTVISCWLPAPEATEAVGANDLGPYPAAADLVGRIVGATGSSHVRVLLHIQRQDQLMERAYADAVLAGGSHEFAEQFPHRYEPVLDYGLLVNRLRAVPGVFAVRVRPLELAVADTAAFVDDMLSAIGVSGEMELNEVPSSVPVAASCTARGIRVAAAMNAHLDDADERASVRKFVLEHFAVAHAAHVPRILRDNERARVLRAHAGVNRELFAEHVPDLPPDSYSSESVLSATRPPRRTGPR